MKISRRLFVNGALAATMVPPTAGLAFADDYPARPVRSIVPFAPGGQTDVVARLVAQRLSDKLGKNFYVEKPGG